MIVPLPDPNPVVIRVVPPVVIAVVAIVLTIVTVVTFVVIIKKRNNDKSDLAGAMHFSAVDNSKHTASTLKVGTTDLAQLEHTSAGIFLLNLSCDFKVYTYVWGASHIYICFDAESGN